MPTAGGMFDGIGLLAYGLHAAGWEHRWLCESDEWRRGTLQQRWPGVPVLNDVRAVSAATCERVDLIAGGFPCKGASTAGKRNGFQHPETVLWREMARAVGELEPRFVLIENVANLLALHDGAVWGEVLADLAALGYDVTWDCLPAAAVGAPHLRDRVFAIACHPERVAGAAGLALDRRPEALAQPGQVERLERPDRDPGTPADAEGGPARCDPKDSARGLASEPGRGGPASPDTYRADGRGRSAQGRLSKAAGAGDAPRGVSVDWGAYQPAIRRWAQVVGAAPEPLIRRLDDGDPAVQRMRARMDRQRLSALGDGVQVQVAQLVGAHLMNLMREEVVA